MRITRIVPALFGRFTTPTALTIPPGKMVVIYGENETGKSTYADLAVTLLSESYDMGIISRYGTPNAPIKGHIELANGNNSLTVEFKNIARIPSRTSEVKRKESDSTSPIWDAISSLDPQVVRNLFRLNAVEIGNGEAVKEKFKNYGFGDKRGTSVTSVRDSYKSRITELTRLLRESQVNLEKLENNRTEAEGSGPRYRTLLKQIEEAETEKKDYETELATLRDTETALRVCTSLEMGVEKAREAELCLREAEENGLLVPLTFGTVHGSVHPAEEKFSAIRLEELEDTLTECETTLAEQTTIVDDELRGIGLNREQLLSSRTLADQQPRNEFFTHIQRKLLSRESYVDELDRLHGQNHTVEVNSAENRVRAAADAWTATGVTISAHEFAGRPDALEAPTQTSASGGRADGAWVLAALGVAGVVVGLLTDQTFGALFSGAIGIVGFVMLRRSRPSSSVPAAQASDPIGRDLLHGLAKEVIDSRNDLETQKRELEKVRERIPFLESEIDRLDSEVRDALSGVGLDVVPGMSSTALSSLFEKVAGLVTQTQSLGNLVLLRDRAKTEVEKARHGFEKLRDRLLGDFSSAEIDIPTTRVKSPVDAVDIIRDWCGRWNQQVQWRQAETSLRGQIEAQNHLAPKIRELLALDPDARNRVAVEIREAVEGLVTKRDELNSKIQGLNSEANTLSTDSRLVEINASIAACTADIRDTCIEMMRLHAQVKLIESLARKRAEESKPELVRRVQEMVLAVADDWKSIEFDEDGNSVTVERHKGGAVKDVALSAGARSLLFTAMRVAIMQQEADGDNGVHIPLFCDDPLLHLDDQRTRQAMRMLRDQADGHQVLYFTCKKEIRNLANELGIPVVTIG
jgi:hypothetical protein